MSTTLSLNIFGNSNSHGCYGVFGDFCPLRTHAKINMYRIEEYELRQVITDKVAVLDLLCKSYTEHLSQFALCDQVKHNLASKHLTSRLRHLNIGVTFHAVGRGCFHTWVDRPTLLWQPGIWECFYYAHYVESVAWLWEVTRWHLVLIASTGMAWSPIHATCITVWGTAFVWYRLEYLHCTSRSGLQPWRAYRSRCRWGWNWTSLCTRYIMASDATLQGQAHCHEDRWWLVITYSHGTPWT